MKKFAIWIVWLTFGAILTLHAAPGPAQGTSANTLSLVWEAQFSEGFGTVTWLPDERGLIACGENGCLHIDDNFQRVERIEFGWARLPESSFVLSVSLASDGFHAAILTLDGTVHILNHHTMQLVEWFRLYELIPRIVAWRPHSSQLLIGYGWNAIFLYDAFRGQVIRHHISENLYGIDSLAWHPTGDYVALTSSHGFFHLWRPEQEAQLQSFQTGSRQMVAVSPDGHLVATAMQISGGYITCDKPVVFLLHLATLQPTQTLSSPSCTDDFFQTIVWHPSGNYLAIITGDNQLIIWETNTGEEVTHTVAMGVRPVADMTGNNMLAWSDDGRFLAEVGWKGGVRVYAFEPY